MCTMASWMVTQDVLFRIRVTLSSRKTVVNAFPTTAQAYSLEGTENPSWQSIASGVPCTIKVLESPEEDSPFVLKYVLADIQSGMSVWEEYVASDANYYAYQETFHTFKGKSGKRFGIRISEENVADNILEHMYDLSLELAKHEAGNENTSADASPDAQQNGKSGKRRIRRVNTLSKKDISLPCNFVHVSGVSKEKNADSEHLSSFLERKMKSLSAIVLPSNRRTKKSPPTKFRSSTDISHERIFAKAMATPVQPSTPQLENKSSSNAVQRNTWNFGMLRKHSSGSIKAEKPRKGLFRRNSFSGLFPSHLTETVDISAPVLVSKPASLDHEKSPDVIKPSSPGQSCCASEPVRQKYTPSPPHSAAIPNGGARPGHNVHYNTLPSSLRRSNSTAGCTRNYIPRSMREEYDTLAPMESTRSTDCMTMTRYNTEPAGLRLHNHSYPVASRTPYGESTRSCGSTSDLVLRKPARSQYSHMKEEEITAAAAATIARYTEKMAKALQQFDDVLLQDSPKTPHSSAVVC